MVDRLQLGHNLVFTGSVLNAFSKTGLINFNLHHMFNVLYTK
jgi:hypothetical protein